MKPKGTRLELVEKFLKTQHKGVDLSKAIARARREEAAELRRW